MIADLTADAFEPWWIIGSAAVALHGAPVTAVRDVDVMMGVADARRVLDRLDVPSEPDTRHRQFRSTVFGTWCGPPLPVEIFAGFSLADSGGWQPVLLKTRQAIPVSGLRLYVPSVRELHDLLRAFGRPKDLERARLLDRLSARAPGPAPAQPPGPRRSSS